MMGIIIGLSSVIVIVSIGEGFHKYTFENITDSKYSKEIPIQMIFNPYNDLIRTEHYFTNDDFNLIKSIHGVSSLELINKSPNSFSDSVFIANKIKNIDISLVDEFYDNILYGEGIIRLDSEFLNKKVVISKEFSITLTDNISSLIGKEIVIKDTVYIVSGIYDNEQMDFFSSDIVVPSETYKFYNGTKETVYLTIYINSDVNLKKTSDNILELMENFGTNRSEGTYNILNLDSLLKGFGSVISGLTIFVSTVAGISLLIASVGVMNMMYSSVIERSSEVGIRRATGATIEDIRNQFLIEGIILTSIAGMIGYLIGILLSQIVGLLLPFHVPISTTGIVVSLLVIFTIGIVSSVGPAKYISKKEIIKLLR
ncbi:ABC transporter permease [Granulicatella sp. zg-ZJ]|uniref:ABC transporter permease n=1 Tax=Granulicatella sp. zg-ZJ TaxID=2678504 RepID=UPI0013D81EF4|nr:FtsX-like permease family protein [Granulicatella sp. zg-ZJ]